jgi:hypothetical protein
MVAGSCRFGLVLGGLLAVSSLTLGQAPPGAGRPGDVPRAAAGERRADLMGRVTEVSPDGRSVTIAMSPRPPAEGQPPARDARPEQANFTLSDRTEMAFFGVGEGEARPAPGLMAMVWLEEGSKDRAARVRFMRREGEERPDVQGRVVSVSPDGRTVTVETREGDRPGGKVDLRLAPYTQALFYGVDQGGAKPTADYQVVAWLEKGSRDVPVRIRFMKGDGRQ